LKIKSEIQSEPRFRGYSTNTLNIYRYTDATPAFQFKSSILNMSLLYDFYIIVMEY